MPKIRTFVAVPLSAGVQRRASDLIERLKASEVRVNWVAPENMHITLKFLGEQTDDEVATVCRAVIEAVKPLPPFEFCCHGVGAFPNCRRPRTLWIGVQEGADALCTLQQCVEAELAEHGYPTENRAYHPHLTVGRVRSRGGDVTVLGELVEKAKAFQVGRVQTDEVIVFGSHLSRGGPRYEVLARAPLDG